MLFCFLERGIPKELRERSLVTGPVVDERDFPTAEVAAAMYCDQFGTNLTEPSDFAVSPFRTDGEARLCSELFAQQVPDLSLILDGAVNRNYTPLHNALLQLISISRHVSQ